MCSLHCYINPLKHTIFIFAYSCVHPVLLSNGNKWKWFIDFIGSDSHIHSYPKFCDIRFGNLLITTLLLWMTFVHFASPRPWFINTTHHQLEPGMDVICFSISGILIFVQYNEIYCLLIFYTLHSNITIIRQKCLFYLWFGQMISYPWKT